MDETAKQVEVLYYPEWQDVNGANTWDEGLYTYPRRSVELLPEGEACPQGAIAGSDISQVLQKSALAIVPDIPDEGKGQTLEAKE